MENMKAISVQMPEETYQRMKAYLKRHGMTQKDFISMVLRQALDEDDTKEAP